MRGTSPEAGNNVSPISTRLSKEESSAFCRPDSAPRFSRTLVLLTSRMAAYHRNVNGIGANRSYGFDLFDETEGLPSVEKLS